MYTMYVQSKGWQLEMLNLNETELGGVKEACLLYTSGWAQIHGRDELEIAEKAKLDGWYVEHLSFGLDVKCFFGTIAAVSYTHLDVYKRQVQHHVDDAGCCQTVQRALGVAHGAQQRTACLLYTSRCV